MKGYTFIELLVSSVIFAILAVSVFSAFYAGIFGNRNISESLKVYQSASQVMEWMNADLRNSIVFSRMAAGFEGDSSSMRFLSIADTFRGGFLRKEYAAVSYKREGERLLRMVRLNGAALESEPVDGFEEIARGVKEAVFKYGKIDGAGVIEWQADWRDPAVLPAAVNIRLVLGEKGGAEFERTVYLPLAE